MYLELGVAGTPGPHLLARVLSNKLPTRLQTSCPPKPSGDELAASGHYPPGPLLMEQEAGIKWDPEIQTCFE